MTKDVIQSAWNKSGLRPYNPSTVLSQVPPLENQRPVTAEGAPNPPESTFKTPSNTQEVNELIRKVSSQEISTVATLQAFKKL